MAMDVDVEQSIVMTGQQKGLENAIFVELPFDEHRLCVKHLYSNWSKRFPGKAYNDMIWEATRAPNVQYFVDAMNELKKISVEVFEALDRNDRKKWTKSEFMDGSNCDEFVNNWAEAFNKVIVRARGQPILTMLNIIHGKVVKRLYKQARIAEKWRGNTSPHATGLIAFREYKTIEYITSYNGHARYGVSTSHHAWMVDVQEKDCSCRL
ncbi:hypothetical protein LIER_36245 [Lithospermum erythrorhizon]|uniref:Transposase n=1 Tax=Lithospermum erythrorhizon TaxID=34254 RepID=A0AAV3P300_LITER